MLQTYFPGTYHFLRWRFGHPAHYKRVTNAVVQKYGRKVLEGPFAGMSYIEDCAGSAYIPKILGCYELEIHKFIHYILEANYSTIIDVGCAEGYYAVGFAFRDPRVHVYAFDGNEEAQRLCREMAELNKVEERVVIGGW